MSTLSDPATEIYDLLSKLRAIDTNKKGTVTVLSEVFGVTTNYEEFFLAMTIITKRLNHLRRVVQDSSASDRLKEASLGAIERVSQIFLPQHFNSNWNEMKNAFIDREHLASLLYTSHMLPDKYRFVVPSELERQEIVSKIDDIIASAPSVTDFFVLLVIDALRSIRLCLSRFEIYGTEEVIDRLAQLLALIDQSSSRKQTAAVRNFLKKTVVWVSLAVNALLISDAVPTAIANHMERGPALLGYLGVTPAATVGLLPAPQSTDSDEPLDVDDSDEATGNKD